MVDKLLEQIPRERMLGVVLNRADEQFDRIRLLLPAPLLQSGPRTNGPEVKQLPGERRRGGGNRN